MKTWAPVWLLFMASCSGERGAAPALATCGSSGCNPINGGSQQSTTGGGGNIIDAGTASLTVQAVTFPSSVSDTRAWALSIATSITEPIQAQAPSLSDTLTSDTGNGSVVLSNVEFGNYAWASAQPTSKTSIYVPGIIGIANITSAQVNLPLFLNDDFSFVASLASATPLSLDLTQAQVAVKVVDSQGNGVKNARVVNPGAATVAYANFGTWIDTSLEPYTDSSGRVVLVNLPAPASPGGFVTLSAYGDNLAGTEVKATSAIPIMAGFVSYATIPLNLD